MKRISAIMITGIFLFIINNNTFSQSHVQNLKTTIIEPYRLSITFYKTTNLIFPYAIKSVDRGSRDVLAQKAKGVENILLVKAGRENFTETNLSVITSDGKLYSFILDYSNNPSLLNISFAKDTTLEETVPLLLSGNNEARIQLTTEQIAKEKRMLHAIHDYKYKIEFRLNGIYIKGDVVFYQQEMQRLHEHKHIFPVNDNIALTAMEAHQFLKADVNSVRESYTSTIAGEHVLSDEIFHQINSEFLKGNEWIAYNTASYFLDKHDVYFFNSKDEANDFAESNISEFDNYQVINGEQLSKILTQRFRNETDLFTQKTNFMNEKNFDYLKDQVKFTGFGDVLENALKEKMQKQSPEFQIYHNAKFGNDIAVATLHFRKSEQSDMYFFNKYNLTLKQENSPDMMEQTFHINKGNNTTLKEVYNLMSGRAITKDLTNKEGQVYNAWMQMDFKETDKNGNYQLKHYHTNYGFDLEKELAKHPIKELNNEQDKTRLIESLQKGNRQSVTFIKESNEQKVFLEANPRFKSLNVYDSNMQRVHSQSQKEKNEPEQSVKQEAKKESQKPTDDDSEGIPKTKQKRSRKKGQSIS